MTPAERLRAAATRLRGVAGDATPEGHTHPWLYMEATYGAPADGPTHVAVTCCGASGVQVRHFLHADDGSHETSGTARYIAMMHPPVALALADWLTKEATLSEGFTPREALAVADAVLGGES